MIQSNDGGITLNQFNTLLGITIVGFTGIFGLVVWFLRKGPDRRIDKVEVDITDLGRKVDRMDKEIVAYRNESQTIQREIAENQREVIAMLTASGTAIQADIYALGMKLAVLQERSDIAECFESFGAKLENAIMALAKAQK